MSLIDDANSYFFTAGTFDQKGLIELAERERAIGNVLLNAARQIEELQKPIYAEVTDVVAIVEQIISPNPSQADNIGTTVNELVIDGAING
jgi:hypothetical protein